MHAFIEGSNSNRSTHPSLLDYIQAKTCKTDFTYTKSILISAVDLFQIDNLQYRLESRIIIAPIHPKDTGDGSLCQLLHVLYIYLFVSDTSRFCKIGEWEGFAAINRMKISGRLLNWGGSGSSIVRVESS